MSYLVTVSYRITIFLVTMLLPSLLDAETQMMRLRATNKGQDQKFLEIIGKINRDVNDNSDYSIDERDTVTTEQIDSENKATVADQEDYDDDDESVQSRNTVAIPDDTDKAVKYSINGRRGTVRDQSIDGMVQHTVAADQRPPPMIALEDDDDVDMDSLQKGQNRK